MNIFSAISLFLNPCATSTTISRSRWLSGERSRSRLPRGALSIGDENCRPQYRQILIEYLEAQASRLRDEHRERFRENPLRVLDCKDEACRDVAEDAPKITDYLCGPCKEHFEAVLAALGDEGIEHRIVPTLVRGLDYYTRTAFEWVGDALSPAQNSLGGGGRYDGLAEVLGGPPTPGVGFALGVEPRILLALEAETSCARCGRLGRRRTPR